MTTNWQPSGEWAGQSVAVLLSGPSMTRELAQELGELHDRTIAVKFTARIAPWADMLVALDGNWPQEFRDFAGLRVTGCADDTHDALYVGHVQERVGSIEIRNSGLAAVRVAAGMGASRIVVAGFEPEAGMRWHDDAPRPYTGVRAGMEQIVAELRARGVEVEFYEPAPAVVTFAPATAPTVSFTTGDGSLLDIAAGETDTTQTHDDDPD